MPLHGPLFDRPENALRRHTYLSERRSRAERRQLVGQTMLKGGGIPVGASGYSIDFAALFDGSTGFLSRTFAAGDTTSWTVSMWAFRADRSASGNGLFAASTSTSSDALLISTEGEGDAIDWYDGGNHRDTSRKFRGFTGWTHHVFTWDSANGTATERALHQASGKTAVSIWSPSASQASEINSAVEHDIGRAFNTSNYWWNGLIAEFVFIGGQSLGGDSFAEFDVLRGIWTPIDPSELDFSGVNSCHLNFADKDDLGKDVSGKGNHWSVNGAVSQIGSPSSFTWNPLWENAATLTNGNREHGDAASSYKEGVGTLKIPSVGKWAFGVKSGTAGNAGTGYRGIGIADPRTMTRGTNWHSTCTDIIAYRDNGYTSNDGTNTDRSAIWGGSDELQEVLVDRDAGTVKFYQAGSLVATETIGAGMPDNLLPVFQQYGTSKLMTLTTDFTPSEAGYLPLTMANITADQADALSDHYDQGIYTGTAATKAITGLNFQPDLVEIRRTDSGGNFGVNDAIRGVQKELKINSNAAELSNPGGFQSFDSGGFTVGSDGAWNASGGTFYWRAHYLPNDYSGSTTGSGTAKTYTAKYGKWLGLYKFTGNGTSGHQIPVHSPNGKRPFSVEIKRLDGSGEWTVTYEAAGSGAKWGWLNSTAAINSTGGNRFDDTDPTSAVVNLGNSADVNADGGEYLMILRFEDDDGYCRQIHADCNGSDDGPYITQNHNIVAALWKQFTILDYWCWYDAARSPSNAVDKLILQHATDSEYSAAVYAHWDFCATGGKVRKSSYNSSGAQALGYSIGEPGAPAR